MKEIRVETRIKNNRLYKSIMYKFESVIAFCRTIKLNEQEAYAFINFKKCPYSRHRGHRFGLPTDQAIQICSGLEKPIDYIFPPDMYVGMMSKPTTKVKTLRTMELNLNQAKQIGLSNCMATTEISFDASLKSALLKDPINIAMDTLTKVEKDILIMRYGLNGVNDGMPETLEDIGVKLHICKERVRQIEAKAIIKLRHPSRSKQLRDYL